MASSRVDGGAADGGAGESADLAARVTDPGFTPSIRLLHTLLELFQEDDAKVTQSAERAILRIETQYATRVAYATVAAVKAATRPARGRLAHLAGRLVHEHRDPEGILLAWLI